MKFKFELKHVAQAVAVAAALSAPAAQAAVTDWGVHDFVEVGVMFVPPGAFDDFFKFTMPGTAGELSSVAVSNNLLSVLTGGMVSLGKDVRRYSDTLKLSTRSTARPAALPYCNWLGRQVLRLLLGFGDRHRIFRRYSCPDLHALARPRAGGLRDAAGRLGPDGLHGAPSHRCEYRCLIGLCNHNNPAAAGFLFLRPLLFDFGLAGLFAFRKRLFPVA